MKANELRIGNLITLKSLPNEYQRVLSVNNTEWIDGVKRLWIETDLCEGELFDEFTAIPLTEEWLLKFGFEIEKDPPVDHWHFGINPYTQDWMILIKSLGSGFFYQNGYFRIPYVHSLQNLYFALTGEELELK